MLSYMLPVDEKPPPGPGKAHLQLSLDSHLTNGNRSHAMSKDNSFSSFVSDATTATASHSSATPTSLTDRAKPKLIINGGSGKHQTLKRVSFGSSKGSMVETLIYETPVQEEPETSPIAENVTPFPEDHDQTEDEREKVRVSFVQQSKPQEVVLPDEPVIVPDIADFMMATTITETNHIVTTYNRQESMDSGWENPFRPGGDLSREADEIVELIKGGKPITPTSAGNSSPLPPSAVDQVDQPNNKSASPITESPKKQIASPLTSSTPKTTKNGNVQANANDTKKKSPDANNTDVQRGTVTIGQPGDALQAEHVVIKKKPKCKCCVIQ